MSWFSRLAGFLLICLLIGVGIMFSNADQDNRRKDQAREIAFELAGRPAYPLKDLPTLRAAIPGVKRTLEIYEESRKPLNPTWDEVRLRYTDPALLGEAGCPTYDHLVYVVHGIHNTGIAVSGQARLGLTNALEDHTERICLEQWGADLFGFVVTVTVPSNNKILNIRLPGECAFEKGSVGDGKRYKAMVRRSPRYERANGKPACRKYRWFEGFGWVKR